ncbi:MAG TPA: aminoglycoside phosphotransferase family protein [Desulfobacterales bacterium]|nr:aminoglycoside phosphotransferase family protein [Desulfobacterales bacterium]HIP38272.1 aminoglycoside phosphotransferase family protein [Desulfocapsa sulfexigens]
MTTFLSPPKEVLSRFFSPSSLVEVTSLGQGNINDTFLVHTDDKPVVLQRINDQVFPNPQILINNLQILSSYLLSRPDPDAEQWQEAVLIPALDGSLSIQDNRGSLWRALSYIKDSISVSSAQTALQAEQTGWALGHFHKRLVKLDVKKMQTALPGFHNLCNYLTLYEKTDKKNLDTNSPEIQFCLTTIRKEQKNALALEKAITKGIIRQKITHGDPKIANVLFDKQSALAISLIDLDTVGPGILQHDIGDCLRSVCNIAGEESDPGKVSFDLNFCEMTLRGYFQEAGTLLTHVDRELIYDGVKAIAFELGLRFFTDYLQGGIYFKCKTPEETLQKALVQFMLLQDIIAKKKAINNLCINNS